MSPDRQARLGENEAILRQVNETVEGAAQRAELQEPITFLCECADGACAQHIQLSTQQYEHVRSAASHFVIRPSHYYPDIETVIERHIGYWIVQKSGEAEQVAEETDPRH
jgi:hypothetical protein